LHEEESS
jgi:hypothetical protein